MCRFAAYLGPELPLSALLYDAQRSLQAQSYTPREQLYGALNVDGTGVAWWSPDDPAPLRYRVDRPPWQDANLPALSRRLRSPAQLLAVRSATPGIGFGISFVHPFLHGPLAGTHNGWIGDFRSTTAFPLIQRLPDDLRGELDGLSDSQVLFLLAVAHLREHPDEGLLGAAAAACRAVVEVCDSVGSAATLNLLIGDGTQFVATRIATGAAANSLSFLAGADRWAGAAILASEPVDEGPGWEQVPKGCAAVLDTGGVRVVALPQVAAAA